MLTPGYANKAAAARTAVILVDETTRQLYVSGTPFETVRACVRLACPVGTYRWRQLRRAFEVHADALPTLTETMRAAHVHTHIRKATP